MANVHQKRGLALLSLAAMVFVGPLHGAAPEALDEKTRHQTFVERNCQQAGSFERTGLFGTHVRVEGEITELPVRWTPPRSKSSRQIGTLKFAVCRECDPGGVGPGVVAAFVAETSLKDVLSEVCPTADCHFNWYQVALVQNSTFSDFWGRQVAAPFVDPPRGGFGPTPPRWTGYGPSDDRPGYFDEHCPKTANCKRRATHDVSSNWTVCGLWKNNQGPRIARFLDEPTGHPNDIFVVKTRLAVVKRNGTLHTLLDGFRWASVSNSNGRAKFKVAEISEGPEFYLDLLQQLYQ